MTTYFFFCAVGAMLCSIVSGYMIAVGQRHSDSDDNEAARGCIITAAIFFGFGAALLVASYVELHAKL